MPCVSCLKYYKIFAENIEHEFCSKIDFQLHWAKHQGIREQAEDKVTTAKAFKIILETQLNI
jgi:hypothetical protein